MTDPRLKKGTKVTDEMIRQAEAALERVDSDLQGARKRVDELEKQSIEAQMYLSDLKSAVRYGGGISR